jgi:hypothetical protein
MGIFQGCEYYSPSVGRQVWSNAYVTGTGAASSSPVTAYVISDPDQLFIVQASTAGIGSSMVGYNATVLAGTMGVGNSITGLSNATLASTVGAVAGTSYPFRIIDVYSNYAPPGAFVNGTDNSSAFNIIVVAPNNWARRGTVAIST